MSVVHRLGMRGGAMCGAGPDKFGHLNLSLTGTPAAVTCPECTQLSRRPTRQEQLAALHKAIKRA